MSTPSNSQGPGRAKARLKSWALRSLLVLVSALGTLVIAELCLAALGIPEESFEFLNPEHAATEVFEEDPDLFWRLREDAPGLRVNQHRLRGYWPAKAKGEGELRIACVGDSCSFGTNVRYEETYGMQLEWLLAEARPDLLVTTVLAALPGYSSFQSRRLFESKVQSFEPDWTLIYCGAWNDYVPAMGASDAERHGQAHSSRLLRLWNQSKSKPKHSREEYLAGMKSGDYLEGPRVPLAAFRANLLELIRSAKKSGRTLLIVPPVPAEDRDEHPAGKKYWDAIRAIASETQTPLVDGQALFDRALERVPKDWRTNPSSGLSIAFTDWIHPSALGHRWLAQALAAELIPELPAAENPLTGPETLHIEPIPSVAALDPGELRLRGSGFDEVERWWLGSLWMDESELKGKGELRIDPGQVLPPGRHPLRGQTSSGYLTGDFSLEVRGHPIEATLTKTGNVNRLVVNVKGPAHWTVGLWLSTELREEPAPTRYGSFALACNPDGRPTGRDDLPFQFERLPFGYAGELDAQGSWTLDVDIQADLSAFDAIYLQGGLIDSSNANYGVVTEVVTLVIPK